MTQGACPAVPGVFADKNIGCAERRTALLAYALSPEVDSVVIGGCWNCYFVGHGALEYYYRGADNVVHPFQGGDGIERSLASLEVTLRELARHKKVYLLLDNPGGPEFTPKRLIEGSRLTHMEASVSTPTTPLPADQKQLNDRLRAIAQASRPRPSMRWRCWCKDDQVHPHDARRFARLQGRRPPAPALHPGRGELLRPHGARRATAVALSEAERTMHPKYRPDIDGLRAIAVGSVLAYHAFPSLLPGGFIGVDIFFVISGFLITTILLQSLAAGDFSYRDFYARRIRRIFPALVLVLLATLAFGWYVLLPGEFSQLGKQTTGRGRLLCQPRLPGRSRVLRRHGRDQAAAAPVVAGDRGAVLHLLAADARAGLAQALAHLAS